MYSGKNIYKLKCNYRVKSTYVKGGNCGVKNISLAKTEITGLGLTKRSST